MNPVEDYRPTMPEAVVRDWAQDAQKELVSLRARIDELSRAYAGQGLALEELTDERDRYREALRPFAALDPYKWGSEERVAILAARAALKEPTK